MNSIVSSVRSVASSDRSSCRGRSVLALIVLTAMLVGGCGGGGDDTIPGAAQCDNTCTTYPQSWGSSCPAGQRCIEFRNSCAQSVTLSYQIGCNANGQPGAPTCNCTLGPTLGNGQSAFWTIVDVNDSSSCVPPVSPPCLTSGLAVMVNGGSGANCAVGTRVEFTAGNSANAFGKFDSYDIDVEKEWYSLPLTFQPDAACSQDVGAPLDCRPLWCGMAQCPDAFITSTSGGCSDNRSPAASCQTSFGDFGAASGFLVEYCPPDCATTGGPCPSCQSSTPCS